MRLVTEHEDIIPNSMYYLVWANQDYQKSSFESTFNYWVLVPAKGHGASDFEILSSRQGDTRLQVVTKKSNPILWSTAAGTNRKKDMGKT